MTPFERPMPVKTPTTAPFWDALAQHRIVIQYSPSSDSYVFYPRVRAPRTLADDLEWREISGMGTLYSYTEVVNVDPADLRVGMRMRPVFCDYPEHDVTMLRYEPVPTT